MTRYRSILALALGTALALPAAAQSIDDILAKNTQARGGLEKIRSVKSIKLSGKQSAGGMEVPLTLQLKRPNGARVEATVQGQTLIQAYDGKTGWAIIPFTGSKEPQKLPEEEMRDLQEESDLDGPFVDCKAKGHTVELIGKEDLEGSPVYKVKLTLKSGDVRYVYLDAENFLELKVTSKRKRQGAEMEIDQYMGDYKSVEGLMIPHSIEARMQGQTVSTIVIQKVELNVEMDDAIFRMPAKAEGDAGAADKPAAKTGEKPDAPKAEDKPAPKPAEKPPAGAGEKPPMTF